MANYSFEKGKYGGPCGCIFPWFVEISGDLPIDEQYKSYIPAGFLKCKGQILQADQYPQLAEILGVGANCVYKKENTILQDPDEDGTGGTFQLPDLGSKYITTSSNPGVYSNTTTVDTDTDTILQRAGVEATLNSGGDEVEFNYTGSFRSGGTPLSFSGAWRFVSPPSRTQSTNLNAGNFIAHGHLGTFTIAAQINRNNDAFTAARFVRHAFCRQNGTRCTGTRNFGVVHENLSFSESGQDRDHNHTVPTPILSQSFFGSIPAVEMSASSVITTVKLKTNKLYKVDIIAPKFIICEYLIKY